MAEGVLNGFVIVDQALGSCSLVELVADVDALNIVDEVWGTSFASPPAWLATV